MKTILFWKHVDLYGQLAMFTPILCLLSTSAMGKAVLAYFTVGAWQALSCGIIAVRRPGPVPASRKRYNRLLVIVILLVVTCAVLSGALSEFAHDDFSSPAGEASLFFAAGGIGIAAILLFLGPIMAVWYFRLTLEELQQYKQAIHHRAEIHWKL